MSPSSSSARSLHSSSSSTSAGAHGNSTSPGNGLVGTNGVSGEEKMRDEVRVNGKGKGKGKAVDRGENVVGERSIDEAAGVQVVKKEETEEEHGVGGSTQPATPAKSTPNGSVGPTQIKNQASTSSSMSVDVKAEGPVPSTSINGGVEEMAKKPPVVVTVDPDVHGESARVRGKAKGRREDEVEAMASVAYRFAAALASDHRQVLQPDIETPFEDAKDAVRRLLPYHIFLQPKDDMTEMLERPLSELRGYSAFRSGLQKGKRKATEEELMREEILETRFALDCHKRKRALEKRFRNARIASGKRLAPDPQNYVLAHAALEQEKREMIMLQAEYRARKADWDKLEKEKRAAAAAAASAMAASATAVAATITPRTPVPPQPQSTTKYYPPTAGSASKPPQTPSSTSAVPTASTSTSTPIVTPARSAYGYGYHPFSYTGPNNALANTSAQGGVYQSAFTTVTDTPPLPSWSSASKQFPVTLPVSSLTSLASLGIVPMHPANAEKQPGPVPAILRGTSEDGTQANLEINISALGAAQVSGLAVLLGAVTSRGLAATTPLGRGVSFGGAPSSAANGSTPGSVSSEAKDKEAAPG